MGGTLAGIHGLVGDRQRHHRRILRVVDVALRTDVKGNNDVAREAVTPCLHAGELQRSGKATDGTIGIGHHADLLWACPGASASIIDTKRRGRTANGLAVRAGNQHLDELCDPGGGGARLIVIDRLCCCKNTQ